MPLLVPQKCTTQCSGCNRHQADTAKDTSNENMGICKEGYLVMGIKKKYTIHDKAAQKNRNSGISEERRNQLPSLALSLPRAPSLESPLASTCLIASS